MCRVHWLITDQVAAVEEMKVMVECVRPGHIRSHGGMGVSSWGVPATGSLTCAAGGTVQTEAGGQQCQLFQRRQGKPGLFSLANKAEMEYDCSLQVQLGYKY